MRIRDTAQQPMNLSIKDAEPVRSPEVAHQQQSATQPGQLPLIELLPLPRLVAVGDGSM